jgi:hypothetical protein
MIKITANRVSVGKYYRASPRVVWDVITDTAQWHQWGPTVKRVQLPERFIRKGSRGRVLTVSGIWLPFIVYEYEHARFWRWKVANIKATGHRIQADETGGCYLWFDVPILAAPYFLVCQLALVRIESLLSN